MVNYVPKQKNCCLLKIRCCTVKKDLSNRAQKTCSLNWNFVLIHVHGTDVLHLNCISMASLAHVLGSDGSTWHLLANIGQICFKSSFYLKRKINLRGENNCTMMMFSLTTCNLWGSFISIMHNSLSFRLRASISRKDSREIILVFFLISIFFSYLYVFPFLCSWFKIILFGLIHVGPNRVFCFNFMMQTI